MDDEGWFDPRQRLPETSGVYLVHTTVGDKMPVPKHSELHYRKGRGWFETDGEPFDIKGPWLLTIRCRRIRDLPA